VPTVNAGNLADVSPDGVSWFSYTARAGKVPLSIDSFSLVPGVPKAGRTLLARMVVGRDRLLPRPRGPR
jgi:hypothetical protein